MHVSPSSVSGKSNQKMILIAHFFSRDRETPRSPNFPKTCHSLTTTVFSCTPRTCTDTHTTLSYSTWNKSRKQNQIQTSRTRRESRDHVLGHVPAAISLFPSNVLWNPSGLLSSPLFKLYRAAIFRATRSWILSTSRLDQHQNEPSKIRQSRVARFNRDSPQGSAESAKQPGVSRAIT